MRMYQPAQKPARGQPMKMSPRNQTKDQKGFPPPEPSPPPAAILRAVRKLKRYFWYSAITYIKSHKEHM